jgi:hypothetical protein
MDNGYIVRFIRKDGKPVEEFFYHTYEEAFVHLALFRDDDSGIYQRIEIVRASGNEKAITALTTI